MTKDMKNDMTNAQRWLCVVVHDVAPANWAACEWLLDVLARHGHFPATLLAVPHFHRMPRSAGFERWLRGRLAHGDEVALHGFEHLDSGTPRNPLDRLRRKVYTRGEGEFAALDFSTATRRLQAGRAWLADIGIAPAGFVAPAWLLGDEAWRALQLQPFDYTCTLRHLHLLDPRRPAQPPRRIACQGQVYSSQTAWRRQLSVLWNESLAWRQRDRPVVRLELHPGDDRRSVSESWQRLLRRQAASRQVRTLGQVATELRNALRTTSTPRSP